MRCLIVACRLIYWFPESKAAHPHTVAFHKQSGSRGRTHNGCDSIPVIIIPLLFAPRCLITGNRYDSWAFPPLFNLASERKKQKHNATASSSEMSEFQACGYFPHHRFSRRFVFSTIQTDCSTERKTDSRFCCPARRCSRFTRHRVRFWFDPILIQLRTFQFLYQFCSDMKTILREQIV